MTDLKTSQEAPASALTGTELVRVVQAGGNAAATANQFKTFIGSGGVNSVSNADGSLTISPTTGVVVASLTNTAVTPSSYGSAIASPTYTVNARGQLTAAANVTITPAIGSVTGLGTGVSTALGINVGTAGSFLTGNQTITLSGDTTGSGTTAITSTLATVNANTGTWGSATQASQVTVNGKGLITAAANVTVTPAVGSITGLGTGVATALVSAVTGSGSIVLNVSPSLTTPTLGAATATSINRLFITAPITASTLAVANSKTFTVSNTLTLAGTDSTTITFQGTDTYVGRTTTDTLTNKTLTTPIILTNATCPLLIGGTAASATLTLQSTSGAGTTDAIILQTASQLERMRILTGGNIGMGTNNPQSLVHINTNTKQDVPAVTVNSVTLLQISGADATRPAVQMDSYGTGMFPFFTGRAARGTAASPTAIQSGDLLYFNTGRGYGTSFLNGNDAGFGFGAAENYTATAHGSNVQFYTTPIGTVALAEAARFGPSGGLSIGTATDPGIGSLIVNGSLLHPTVANTTIATVLGSVGPTGAHTTVQEWFPIKNASGVVRYVPGF